MRNFRPLSPEDAHWFCQHVLKDLAAFYYAIDSGNRTDSAEKLTLSPQRVGQALHAVESSLREFLNGGHLIKRHKKIDISPTEAGVVVSEFAHEMLLLGEAFLERLYRVQYGNEIAVAIVHSGWMAYGRELEALYKKRVPDGSVAVQIIGGLKYNEKIQSAVVEGRADVGITSFPPRLHPSLTLQPLKDVEMRLVINPALPRRPRERTVKISSLFRENDNLKIAVHTRSIASPLSSKVLSYLRKCGVDLFRNQRIEGETIAEIKATILEMPNAVSILPIHTILRDVKSGQLVAYALDPPIAPWTWGLLHRTGTSRPAVKQFIECVRPLFKVAHKKR